MRKKIVSLAVAIVFVCLQVMTASAAASSFEIVTDVAKGAINISGTLDAKKGNATLLLRFLDENGTEVFVDYTKSKYENGVVSFAFDKLYLPAALESGTYRVEILGENLEAPLTKSYAYSNPLVVLSALRAVAAVPSIPAAKVGDVITANANEKAKVLGVSLSDYNTFTAEAKTVFETIIQTVEYELPTADDTSCVEREINKFFTGYKKATAAALFVMAEDSGDVAKWIARFYDDSAEKQDANRDESVLGPDPDANLCIKNEDEDFLNVFKNVKASEDFVNRFVAAEGNYNIAQIKEYLNVITLLSAICELTDGQVLDVLEDYPEYFEDINWTDFESLSALKKAAVLDNFAGVHYEDCEEAVEEFNSLIDDTPSSSGGGSGGSSGGGKLSGGKAYSTAGLSQPVKTMPFNDLSSAPWAEEAILYLHNYGIINGRDDGSFAPNSNVTRAEFVKMVIGTMSINISSAENPFNDVGANAWYAPYVASAYKMGLVSGDENGCFNPNSNITRQDMVTILYRALGNSDTKKLKINFSDANTISDYAREAVAYFSNNGIVSGMGDGSFGAQANATRAQTATILYKLMIANQ